MLLAVLWITMSLTQESCSCQHPQKNKRDYSFVSRYIPYLSQFLTPANAYLDCLEPRGAPVALVSLEHLFHRSDQVGLGSLETQHFPLGPWDLGDLEIRACQLALKWHSSLWHSGHKLYRWPTMVFVWISTGGKKFDPGSGFQWVTPLNGFSCHRL